RNKLPQHHSLSNKIANLLNISNDSAYRRIRGEKSISFDETKILCTHFDISLDHLFHINSNSLIFNNLINDSGDCSISLYLNSILNQLKHLNTFENREIIYLSRDIPIFNYFICPELAIFKFFTWQRSLVQTSSYLKKYFSLNENWDSCLAIGRKILDEYYKIPSREIWSATSINSILKQIDYYVETNEFASVQDIIGVYDALERSIGHIEKQAESGFRFLIGCDHLQTKIVYKFYKNEKVVGENAFLALLNDNKLVYLNCSALEIIYTGDILFAERTFKHFLNEINKSNLLSESGELERIKYFNLMREKIQSGRDSVINYKSDRHY
ncbi:MAG TPA: hypothetical protein VGG71_04560, partial [Chitinophagaceae bacterium]